FNRPERFTDCPADLYSFARFQNGSRRALVVVANFRPGAAVQGRIRMPPELVATVGFTDDVSVQLLLDREGKHDGSVATVNAGQLTRDGFPVSVPNQSAYVYAVAGFTGGYRGTGELGEIKFCLKKGGRLGAGNQALISFCRGED